jgi:hypothetical protein
MMKYPDLTFLIPFILLLISSGIAHALPTSSNYPTTNLHVTQHSFSGEKNKSFGDSPTSYSVGIKIMTQKEYFVPYVGIDFGGHTGRQSFLDGATTINSGYNYQYGSGEFGIYFFPIGRRERGINLYVNGAGVAGYHALSLKTSDTLTNISKAEQNFGTGYKGNVGFEWILQNRGNRAKWTLYTEIGFKKETVKLLKQNFSLDTLNYSVGLGW